MCRLGDLNRSLMVQVAGDMSVPAASAAGHGYDAVETLVVREEHLAILRHIDVLRAIQRWVVIIIIIIIIIIILYDLFLVIIVISNHTDTTNPIPGIWMCHVHGQVAGHLLLESCIYSNTATMLKYCSMREL